MSAARNEKAQPESRWGKALKSGIRAGSFITAVVVFLAICFILGVDFQVMAIGLVIVVLLLVGVPLFLFAVRENNDIKDENETCAPIMKAYAKSQSTDKLIADYRAWTEGEHSSYSRVHFGGDIVDALIQKKKYEDALVILDELGSIDMKARERYDYENYRDQIKPVILEGIEKEELHAKERARNKNLRK